MCRTVMERLRAGADTATGGRVRRLLRGTGSGARTDLARKSRCGSLRSHKNPCHARSAEIDGESAPFQHLGGRTMDLTRYNGRNRILTFFHSSLPQMREYETAYHQGGTGILRLTAIHTVVHKRCVVWCAQNKIAEPKRTENVFILQSSSSTSFITDGAGGNNGGLYLWRQRNRFSKDKKMYITVEKRRYCIGVTVSREI